MSEASPSLDLTNCDREPIHVPASIQPHGVLLAVEPGALTIRQVAGDTARMLGREPPSVLGATLTEVLGPGPTAPVRVHEALTEPIYLGSFSMPHDAASAMDLTVHARDGLLILELEPSAAPAQSAAEAMATVRAAAGEMQAAPDLARLLQAAAKEARRVTGFDRVMIYRFLDDGAGAVLAEDKLDRLDPFLHHRYPASDIPKQARALYLRNLIRVIPDVGYAPAPLVPAANPMTGAPLDMSDCSLRSVSPIHVQYLKNMGVGASMSVSIVVDGALWGLIAFHHTEPKLVPYAQREICKHLGEILSQQIKAREQAELHQQTLRLTTAREELIGLLAKANVAEQGLAQNVGAVRNIVPCDGAAIVAGDAVYRTGKAPSVEQVRALADWLLPRAASEPFETRSLARHFPPAASYAAEASGALAAVASAEERLVVLWFRAEEAELVEWAGNPHKPVEPGAAPGMLTPRKSFDLWREIVRERSRPWSTAEVDAARRFGRALFELRQQQRLQALNVQLRRTLADKEVLLEQKDLLMQEVNHRVQNSLQLVNSMLHLQARQADEPQVKTHFEEMSRRIMAISAVHKRLWRSDHIRSVDFGVYLEELRDGLVEAWGSGWEDQIKVHAHPVLIPTNIAVILALVVTELLTNAVKYAYEGEPGRIDVKLSEAGARVSVTVKDHGIGIGDARPSDGLGSRLIRTLVAQLDGELEMAPEPRGTSVMLTVPVSAQAH